MSNFDGVDDAAGVSISDRSKSLLSNPPSSPVLGAEDADPLIRRLRDFPLQNSLMGENKTVNGPKKNGTILGLDEL